MRGRFVAVMICWLIVVAGLIILFNFDNNLSKFFGGMGVGLGMLGAGWNSRAEVDEA
ncbi:hypothetical protein [Brevibacterium oceani]|uniref:hypothetical protein n=1 Tax=Brevibacterium oceani TaxID=358099 RepID=UPI0015E7D0EC|nr:hypothetical protein [Brevibacterium oceani]